MASETYDSVAAVCPLCGYANGDMWEVLRGDNDTHVFECRGCEHKLTSTLMISYTYVTKAVEEPGG